MIGMLSIISSETLGLSCGMIVGIGSLRLYWDFCVGFRELEFQINIGDDNGEYHWDYHVL